MITRILAAVLAILTPVTGPQQALVIVVAVTAAFAGLLAALITRRILAGMHPLPEARP